MISITVTGENRVEIAGKLRAFADNLDGAPANADGKVAPSKTKKAAKPVEVDEDVELETADSDDDDSDFVTDAASDDDGEAFDASDDEDDDFVSAPPPKKKAAEGKAKKVTIAQVNEACKARAQAGGKKGRDQVLSILKKNFKTESISEIKPEMYGKVIQAMAVSQ
jgi:hypothetical protein